MEGLHSIALLSRVSSHSLRHNEDALLDFYHSLSNILSKLFCPETMTASFSFFAGNIPYPHIWTQVGGQAERLHQPQEGSG